jgi:peptide deformylase
MVSIRQKGDPVLAARAAEVPATQFGTGELRQMIADMSAAVDAEVDGVAIAAPQIGLPWRIFLVRYDRMTPLNEGEPTRPADIGVFINPEITKRSRKKEEMEEGCLSVRGIYGTTLRADRATVRAYDAEGKKFERGGGGLLAQAFQHEIDHLDGILFVDHATNLRNGNQDLDDVA